MVFFSVWQIKMFTKFIIYKSNLHGFKQFANDFERIKFPNI